VARSGIGCTFELEPNTASLATNLLAQSCVPDEKCAHPERAQQRAGVQLPSALNAIGLPT
jgi:hypothetical protein